MGGAAGHLNHLYDNYNLSFGELKQILIDASEGKLQVVEKTDGANIFLTFKDGNAYASRNKTNLISGGMDINDLINREFKGGENVKKAYILAFQSFEKSINNLSDELKSQLFQNGNIWYNCEIQGPAFTNIINYDQNIINVHSSGHLYVNPETKEIKSFNNQEIVNLLNKSIDSLEQKNTKTNFQLRHDAVVQLKELSDKIIIKKAISKINKLLSSYRLSDKSKIGDMIRTGFLKKINEIMPESPLELKESIIDNLLGIKKIKDIPSSLLSPEIKKKISDIKKNSDNWKKELIFPLEEVIHDFSVELLKGLRSSFILDNKKESNRLKKEVETAIKIISSSNNEEAVKILQQQLKKLKNLENVSPMEGVVFQYGDIVYKLTGNFAPINQILGLFKYGRGEKIKPFIREGEVNKPFKEGKKIAVIPGGFKPPHAGHYNLVKYLTEDTNIDIDKTIVFISPKTRSGTSEEGNTILIDAYQSLKLWKLYTKNNPKIKPIISENSSPIKTVYEFMETLKPGDTIIMGKSQKEEEIGDTRFDRAQEYSNKNNLGVKVVLITTPLFSEGVSGTQMRNLIAEGDKKQFFKYLPSHLSDKEKEISWNILYTKTSLKEKLIYMIKNEMFYQKKPSLVIKEKKESSDMKNRVELYEKLILRKHVRNLIKEISKEKETKKNKLRNYIKKLIKEASDYTPHEYTGINVLETLLKKIIPILEEDYKTLTTSEEQRKSFRSHITNAIENSLAPIKTNKGAGELEKMISIDESEFDLSEEEEINVNIGDDEEEKFIDIDKKEEPSDEEIKKDNFTVPGEDLTGRNQALKSFEKIEQNILDSYNILSNDEDRSLFYDYLLSNVNMYMDRWEEELSNTAKEPFVPEYEMEKSKEEDEEEEFPSKEEEEF